MTPLYWALVLIVVQRTGELAWAARNTALLRRLGAVEADAAGYPCFIMVHAGWLASLALLVPAATPPNWRLLGLMGLLQPVRLWVVLSLGRYWTTRVLTLPTAPPGAR